MSEIKDGGPAFPSHDKIHGVDFTETGMSLRDYLASNAGSLPEDCVPELMEALAGPKPACQWLDDPRAWFEWSAKADAVAKYMQADAMLAAREVKP